MLHFIIASHGPFADALITSAKMVFGELVNTTSVCLTEQGGIEQFKKDFEAEISKVATGVDGVVVLCDLECGTPYNVACTYAFNPDFPTPVEVVTGINFPTLLIATEYIDEKNVSAVAEAIRKEALNTIVVAKPAELVEDEEF